MYETGADTAMKSEGKRPRRWRTFVGALAVVTALLAWRCVTPLIPIPLPDPQGLSLQIKDSSKGLVAIKGKLQDQFAGAYIFVLNERTGGGVITRAGSDGSFVTPIFVAKDGDPLDLWAKWSPDQQDARVKYLKVSYADGGKLLER